IDEDCEGCVFSQPLRTFSVVIQSCVECEVEAGTALETSVCTDDVYGNPIALYGRLTGADGGGTWTYLGYSATEMGSYTPGVDDPGTLTGFNPNVSLLGWVVGFHK